jgi:hypothetical protein
MSAILEGRPREALYAFAYTMLESQRLAEAVSAFRVLVRFAPTDERAWLGLGACHELLDQPEVAVELYGAGAVIAMPPSARCHLALARVARASGEASVALEHVELAATLVAAGETELSAIVEDERRRTCTL